MLERLDDLVTQLRDKTAHDFHDRLGQEYEPLKEQSWHVEAAAHRLVENFREMERRLKAMERFSAHRRDAIQAFELAPTDRDPN